MNTWLAVAALWVGLSVLVYFALLDGPGQYLGHRDEFKRLLVESGEKLTHLPLEKRRQVATRIAFGLDCFGAALFGGLLTGLILAVR